MKSITFLMPGNGHSPAGGYKIVYEYANRLAEDGYSVHIVYPVSINFKKSFLKEKIKSILRFPYWGLKGYSCKRWFHLNPGVKEHLTFSLNYSHIPKTDVYVATAVQTSYYLASYPIENSKKLYLIQGFETWSATEEYVYNSYKLGLKNIVISDWLAEKVKSVGADFTIIKNGFDFDYFQLSIPIEEKDKYSISMLYNKAKIKGCKYGLDALEIVRTKYPQLKANLFGVSKRPEGLPEWIMYYQCPDRETHNRIYNQSAIYLAPSLQEGWGLPVGEAMICGSVPVCTETLGFKEMVRDGVNGYIVPIKDSEALASKIVSLIEDDETRKKMAKRGNSDIKKFRWNLSYSKFKNLIESSLVDVY